MLLLFYVIIAFVLWFMSIILAIIGYNRLQGVYRDLRVVIDHIRSVLLGEENVSELEALLGEKLISEEGTVERVDIMRVSPAMGPYPGAYGSLIYVSVNGEEKLLVGSRGLGIIYRDIASGFWRRLRGRKIRYIAYEKPKIIELGAAEVVGYTTIGIYAPPDTIIVPKFSENPMPMILLILAILLGPLGIAPALILYVQKKPKLSNILS